MTLEELAAQLRDEYQRVVVEDATVKKAETWHVMGRASLHVVTAGEDGLFCDCEDYRVRGGPCKHALRVLLARGDRTVIERLRVLVPGPRHFPARRRQGAAS